MANTERKEYAKLHYENLKEYIQTMENENLDPERILYRILGYVNAWDKNMTKLCEKEYSELFV